MKSQAEDELQTKQEVIIIHMLPKISRSKDNQEMKLGQLTKYSVKSIFHSENEVKKLVPEPFFVS